MRIAVVLMALIVSSCVDKNPLDSREGEGLAGEWQLKEQKIGYGPPGEWEDVENGKIIEFTSGTFKGLDNFNSSCDSGTYEIKDDELLLTYTCGDQNDSFVYSVILEGTSMIISPRTVICIEGCEYRYQKISD